MSTDGPASDRDQAPRWSLARQVHQMHMDLHLRQLDAREYPRMEARKALANVTAYRIPNCCAMPLNGKPGDVYDCLTCHTRYRYLAGWDWILDGPIVELGAEQWPPDHIPELDEHERRL